MRILSLNTWGGRVFAPLIEYLPSVDADVLCLQEMVHTPASQKPWLDYRDGTLVLPQRANLFAEIAAALPEHTAILCPAARGDLFDGDTSVPSDWGLATFVRKPLAIIGQAQDFVHGQFSSGGWGPHPRTRNAHVVRIHDAADAPITIAHMHGLRDPVTGKADTPEREAQADKLVALIKTVWRPGERLVVCGDFNVLPGSVTFERLATLGLTDLVTSRGHTETRTSFYEKPGRYADYLLVTPNVEVVAFDVPAAPEVSDHRALVLDIA